MLGVEPKVSCVLGKALPQSCITNHLLIGWFLRQDLTELLKLTFD